MPLHRSILFWLGLFVLSFILWAWADSRRHYSSWSHSAAFSPGEDFRRWNITHYGSAISIGDHCCYASPADHFTSLPSPVTDYRRGNRITSVKAKWFAAARLSLHVTPGSGGAKVFSHGMPGYPTVIPAQRNTSFQIPHWLIVLAYLISFTTLLRYRARKRRQHLLPTPPQAQTSFEN